MKFSSLSLRLLLSGAVLSVALCSLPARAQGPGSGGPQPSSPTAVPLDGGASLLLLGGAAYALRRLRRRPQGPGNTAR